MQYQKNVKEQIAAAVARIPEVKNIKVSLYPMIIED